MTTDIIPGPSANPRLLMRSGTFIGFVIMIALLTLIGWQWDIAIFRRPLPGPAAMNPMTALSFLIIAFSFLLIKNGHGSRWKSDLSMALCMAVLLIALARIASTFSPSVWKIDHLVYPGRMNLDQSKNISGSMALNTAFCFIFSSFSLWFQAPGNRRRIAVSQCLALLTTSLSLFSIIGYIYRVKVYYGALGMVPMAIHTALCFLFLSFALLLAAPEEGIMRMLMGPLTGSMMARRLLPLAIVVPVILGFLRLFGQWYGIFSVEFGAAILVMSIIFSFMILLWYNTLLLNKRDLAKKAVEEDLRAIEERFRLLVQNVKDYAIFMVDPDGRIASWNGGAEAIKGYTAGEVIGRSISIFYEQEEIEKDVPRHNLAMAKEYGHFQNEGWRIRKDGTRFWADIVITAIYDEWGSLKGFAKITRDMTESKKDREKIAYQARLMEDTSDAIMSTDSLLRIVSWNRAAETLYKIGARDAMGQPIGDILETTLEEDTRIAIRRELFEKGYWKGDVTYFTNDNPITVSISVSGTRDDQGIVDGYVIVCRDITERIRAEKQLRKFNVELESLVKAKTAELTSVFERVSDGFMAFDKMGQITYANKKAAEMNRRSIDQLIGRNFWVEFPSAAGNEFGENFHKSIGEQQNVHFEMYSPSLQLWIECYMYPSPNGISLFFRDITGQIKAQEMLVRSNTELRELASHLQDIREEERATIAREIHDELGQQLTGLKMDLSWISRKVYSLDPGQVQEKVKITLDLLDNTIHTVRRIATALRPSILDDLGLIAAIEWQSQEFEKRSGIRTLFRSGMPEMDFPKAIAIGLFRICQESLTNVARHSSATTVCITLDHVADRIIFTVTDNGKGMDKSKIGAKKTLGLLGMKERAMMMGGELSIVNNEYGGLKLEVDVPIAFSIPQ